jgi:excisionase family DNA binding protein
MEDNARDRRGGNSDQGELLTSAEVASLFGVDRRTVVLWAKRGRLPALRTPGGQHRFRADEIRRLLGSTGGYWTNRIDSMNGVDATNRGDTMEGAEPAGDG